MDLNYGEKKKHVWGMELVHSGVTTRLDLAQKTFNKWGQETEFDSLSGAIWSFDNFKADPEAQEKFFTYVSKHLQSIPSGWYTLHYLLSLYVMEFDEQDFRRLWEYVESVKDEDFLPSIPETKDAADQQIIEMQDRLAHGEHGSGRALSGDDFRQILYTVCGELWWELPSGIRGRKKDKWIGRFITMIKEPRLADVRDLALGLDFDLETYQLFRKKVLKIRSVDFLDKSEVLIFLSLRYGGECGLSAYNAHTCLKKIYQNKRGAEEAPGHPDAQEMNIQQVLQQKQSGNITMILEERLIGRLESGGILFPRYKEKLFSTPIPFLQDFFREIEVCKKNKVKRSPHAVLLQEWKRFSRHFGFFEYDEDRVKDNVYDVEQILTNRHQIFRSLYGEKAEGKIYESDGGRRGIKAINKDDLVKIAPQGVESFFLDSEEFGETMFNDAVFNEHQPIKNPSRLRNLILTAGFLNHVYTDWEFKESYKGNSQSDQHTESLSEADYQDRLVDFELEMMQLTASCDYLSLHSGNAYDAFLKLLLSCDKPFALFKYIWHLKTGSLAAPYLLPDREKAPEI